MIYTLYDVRKTWSGRMYWHQMIASPKTQTQTQKAKILLFQQFVHRFVVALRWRTPEIRFLIICLAHLWPSQTTVRSSRSLQLVLVFRSSYSTPSTTTNHKIIMFAASRRIVSPNALRPSATAARWTALRSFSNTSAVSEQYDVVIVGESSSLSVLCCAVLSSAVILYFVDISWNQGASLLTCTSIPLTLSSIVLSFRIFVGSS